MWRGHTGDQRGVVEVLDLGVSGQGYLAEWVI